MKTNLKQSKVDFAVAYKNLNTGDTLFINVDEDFHAASTMKTPVMFEAFRQIEQGKFFLTDSMIVRDTFFSIVDGSPYAMEVDSTTEKILHAFVGKKITINDMIHEMITVSSNLASNNMIDFLDVKNIQTTMKEIGANGMHVLRGVEDLKAYEKGMSNHTSARGLIQVFDAIAINNGCSPESSKEMLSILGKQFYRDIIPAKLPKEARVFNKTGSITGVRHDSGIVRSPDGTAYILVLLYKNLEQPDAGIDVLGEVSRMIYDEVVGI